MKLFVFVSDKVPEIVVGDPGRFCQNELEFFGENPMNQVLIVWLALMLLCLDHSTACQMVLLGLYLKAAI